MTEHKLKYVRFYGRDVPVVLQNENGPCPLLAIANVLLLRDAIQLPANTFLIEQEKLMDILAEYLLDNNPVEPSSRYSANLRQNLEDVISNMHKLTTGLDVNPKFSSIRGFEFTNETAIFDLFNISLVHGWIIDPEENVAASVGEMSYNQVVAKLISTLGAASLIQMPSSHVSEEQSLIDMDTVIEAKTGTQSPVACDMVVEDGSKVRLSFNVEVPKEEETKPAASSPSPVETDSMETRKWSAVREWMHGTPSQLSTFGLFQLHQQLREKELTVFFRNNHFNTVFKNNKALYILVTDQGYLSENDLIWEKLESVNNDNQFYTADFKVFQGTSQRQQQPPPPVTDHDLQYALAASMSPLPNENPTSTLPDDFLSVSPQPAHSTNQDDADLAYALFLQEQENAQSVQQPSDQRGPPANNPGNTGSGRQPATHYARMPGRPGNPLNAQQSFPPTAYTIADAGGRYPQQPPTSHGRGQVPVSQNESNPPPETFWSWLRKRMSRL